MASQRDIADRLGISVMTVSRVMRGMPTVRPELAEAIRRVADEIGYRPNPLVQSLMVQRARRRVVASGVVVAWLGRGGPSWAAASGVDGRHPFCRYYGAAAQRLLKAGMKLDDFGLQEGVSPEAAERLGRVLRARGVAGILLGPATGGEEVLPVGNPGDFALVQVGRSRHHTNVDRVTGDAFQAMSDCLNFLRDAGCRRIGFFDGASHNLRNERRWEAAHGLFQPPMARIPARLVVGDGDFTRRSLADYVGTRRLDAVVSGRAHVHNWLTGRLAHIRFACPNLEEATGPVPGVVAGFEQIGADAAGLLIDAIHAGRRGPHERSRTLSITGEWYPGG
jgi:DNA-binding LacI/PurR family transcriptional regulator